MESNIAFTMRGFPDEASAIAASKRVGEVIDETASALRLSLAGLDGVTIAYNYDAALAELSRGFLASGPLAASADDFATGVAMSPRVLRNGKVKSHVVLSAAIVPLIDAPQAGVSGKYIIAHELAHVHETYFMDKLLPGLLLQQNIFGGQEIFLFATAESCWSEYAASAFSAPVCPDHGRLYETTFVAALPQLKERVLAAKREWVTDNDYYKVWKQISGDVTTVLRYASYLMGHVASFDKPFEEAAKDAWRVMEENTWLLPRFEEQFAILAEMINTFSQWKGLEAFDPLKELVRNVFEDCGVPMCQLPNGTLHIWIKDGKLPI